MHRSHVTVGRTRRSKLEAGGQSLAGKSVSNGHSIKKQLITIIPAYNEERGILDTIIAVRKLTGALSRLNVALQIVVVDDGSTDCTRRRAVDSGAAIVVSHNTNQGLGAAVRTGLRTARDMQADIVVKFDADLQHDPSDILALIRPILASDANIVYGNRFERLEYKMPLIRKLGNAFFTKLMRLLTGWDLADSQPGIFAVDRIFLANFMIAGNYNYTQQILLDAFHRDLRFAQVPVRFRKRETGSSFVSFKYPFVALLQILLIILAFRPLYVFGTIGIAFLFIAGAVFTVEVSEWIFGYATKPVEHVNLVLGASSFGLNVLFLGLLAQLIIIRQHHR
jgi:glycosyltransferase involved in cell wall biosynthesis